MATARLGRPARLVEGPEPVIGGFGPGAFRFRVAVDGEESAGSADGSADASPRSEGALGDWAGPLLARRAAPEVLAHEAAWTEAVTVAGFPAAAVVAHDPDREVVVLRAPAGTSLTEVMITDMARTSQLLGDLGRLHARLHALPAERVAADATAGGAGAPPAGDGDPARHAASDEVRAALADELAWLDTHLPPAARPVVCHGDLHPSHVYLRPDDPASTVVVNWTAARLADPELDVARTAAAFWFSPYYLDNAMYRKVMKMARESLASAYLDAYRDAAAAPLDGDRLRYWQAHQIGTLAADLCHRVHHGPRDPWDPMGGVVHPERTLGEMRDRFWELTRS
jgi:aminoglycoside phosphotransferase (APT) family kinase protein